MRPHHPLAGLLAAVLVACASAPPPLPDAPVLIYGEQHDQPAHQRRVAEVVRTLAADGRLGAVVIEMAERGRSTAGLPRDADAAQVRAALAWSGWEWPVYEGVVMAAVRAGVPVLGGNLPRERLRETMGDTSRDAQVDGTVRNLLTEAVRTGHCGLLPTTQEPGMVRVQIGRDRSMAEAVAAALASQVAPGRVVLLTGALHAARDRGVPWHLGTIAPGTGVHVTLFGEPIPGLPADTWQPAPRVARPDPCEGLARQLERKNQRPPS